jgi:hypothetical protein
MADAKPDKSTPRTILTGAAQPVTNSVERARKLLGDRPEPSAPPPRERKNFRPRKSEGDATAGRSAEPEPEPERETED